MMMWSVAWLAVSFPLLAQAPSCAIEGRVSNLFTGSVVRKAQVLLGPQQGIEKYRAVTDSEGHYSIAGITPGKYRLWVQRSGFLPVSFGAHGPNRPGKFLVLAAGDVRKDLDFILEPPAVITGHIYDQDGDPLTGSVQLFRQNWRNGRIQLDTAGGANADDEGQYRLYGLPSGSYVVSTAQRPIHPASPVPSREIYPRTFYPGTEDAASAAAIKLAPGSEAQNIDFHLRKTVTVVVKGVVINPAPETGIQIRLWRRDGVASLAQISMMNQNTSEFSIPSVTPGSYVLSARPTVGPGNLFARFDLDVGTLDVEGAQIDLSPTLEAPGALKFEGAEPPDLKQFSITLSSAEPGVPPAAARPDEKGALAWKGLTPGTWTLDFSPKLPGLYLKSAREIEIGADGPKPIDVVVSSQGARVEGKVHAAGDKPDAVEAATVLLISETKPASVTKFAISDADGAYSLAGIPPGAYRVLALEDIEAMSWENPEMVKSFEGKGSALTLGAGEKATRDLALSH